MKKVRNFFRKPLDNILTIPSSFICELTRVLPSVSIQYVFRRITSNLIQN